MPKVTKITRLNSKSKCFCCWPKIDYSSLLVKTILRKSQEQFWGKLRKLRLRKNDGFLIKKVHFPFELEMMNISLITKLFLYIICCKSR